MCHDIVGDAVSLLSGMSVAAVGHVACRFIIKGKAVRILLFIITSTVSKWKMNVKYRSSSISNRSHKLNTQQMPEVFPKDNAVLAQFHIL